MHYDIQQKKLTEEIKEKIFQGFGRQAFAATGMNGLSEDAISFEIYNSDHAEFLGAIVIQAFWGQLHIKYLYVDEKYRMRGIGTKLMQHALDYGKNRGFHFAFVETMNYQAPQFYKKMGFVLDFSREGFANNTQFLYLKKNLMSSSGIKKKMIRSGVYGIVLEKEKMLLVVQPKGPLEGRYDFPGGGIEFSESPEEALRREFMEEIGMSFTTMTLYDNLTSTIEVPSFDEKEAYSFYQIGMLYKVEGVEKLKIHDTPELEFLWLDIKSLTEKNSSPLLWKYKQMAQ